MKVVAITLILLAVGNMAIGIQIGQHLQYAADAEVLKETMNYAEDWKGVAEHYEFWLDKLTEENKQAKADIDNLLEACEDLREEKDVIYEALHRELNKEQY